MTALLSTELHPAQRLLTGVIVCVCGCGEDRPADSRSKSVGHVDEYSDSGNNNSNALITTIVLLTMLKAFQFCW